MVAFLPTSPAHESPHEPTFAIALDKMKRAVTLCYLPLGFNQSVTEVFVNVSDTTRTHCGSVGYARLSTFGRKRNGFEQTGGRFRLDLSPKVALVHSIESRNSE